MQGQRFSALDNCKSYLCSASISVTRKISKAEERCDKVGSEKHEKPCEHWLSRISALHLNRSHAPNKETATRSGGCFFVSLWREVRRVSFRVVRPTSGLVGGPSRPLPVAGGGRRVSGRGRRGQPSVAEGRPMRAPQQGKQTQSVCEKTRRSHLSPQPKKIP